MLNRKVFYCFTKLGTDNSSISFNTFINLELPQFKNVCRKVGNYLLVLNIKYIKHCGNFKNDNSSINQFTLILKLTTLQK